MNRIVLAVSITRSDPGLAVQCLPPVQVCIWRCENNAAPMSVARLHGAHRLVDRLMIQGGMKPLRRRCDLRRDPRPHPVAVWPVAGPDQYLSGPQSDDARVPEAGCMLRMAQALGGAVCRAGAPG